MNEKKIDRIYVAAWIALVLVVNALIAAGILGIGRLGWPIFVPIVLAELLGAGLLLILLQGWKR